MANLGDQSEPVGIVVNENMLDHPNRREPQWYLYVLFGKRFVKIVLCIVILRDSLPPSTKISLTPLAYSLKSAIPYSTID
jgi:hypothetical protein